MDKLVRVVQNLESRLEKLFKNLPALPKSAKETLVQIWPWLALFGGLLQLAAAWTLKGLTDTASSYIDLANKVSVAYGGKTTGLSAVDRGVVYLGIMMLVVDAVIMLIAFSPLKERLRRGWDLLFLASVANVIYAVLSLFVSGKGFGSFVGGLLGSAIGFYLLYQVKPLYSIKVTTTGPKRKTNTAA